MRLRRSVSSFPPSFATIILRLFFPTFASDSNMSFIYALIAILRIVFVIVGTIRIERRIYSTMLLNVGRRSIRYSIGQLSLWVVFFFSRLIISNLVGSLLNPFEIVDSEYVNSLINQSIYSPGQILSIGLKIVIANTATYFMLCSMFWSALQYIDQLPNSVCSFLDKRILVHLGINGEQWFWIRHLKLGLMVFRHFHFPLDIISFVGVWLPDFGGWSSPNYSVRLIRMKLKFRIAPVDVSNFFDDSAWPSCSFMYAIMLFACPKCFKENRIYVLRMSFYSRQALAICSWPLPKTRFDGWSTGEIDIVRCRQSGGFVITEMIFDFATEYYIYDMRANNVVQLHPTVVQWQELRNRIFWYTSIDRRTMTLYIRVIYWRRDDLDVYCGPHRISNWSWSIGEYYRQARGPTCASSLARVG